MGDFIYSSYLKLTFNYWQPYIIPTAQKIDELPKDLKVIDIDNIKKIKSKILKGVFLKWMPLFFTLHYNLWCFGSNKIKRILSPYKRFLERDDK